MRPHWNANSHSFMASTSLSRHSFISHTPSYSSFLSIHLVETRLLTTQAAKQPASQPASQRQDSCVLYRRHPTLPVANPRRQCSISMANECQPSAVCTKRRTEPDCVAGASLCGPDPVYGLLLALTRHKGRRIQAVRNGDVKEAVQNEPS